MLQFIFYFKYNNYYFYNNNTYFIIIIIIFIIIIIINASIYSKTFITPGQAAIEYTYIIGERRSKYLKPEFSIANRGPNGDKWQSKTLFLSVFDPRLSIVKSVFDCHLFSVSLVRNVHNGICDNPRCQIIPRARRSYLGHKILILRFLPNKRLCIKCPVWKPWHSTKNLCINKMVCIRYPGWSQCSCSVHPSYLFCHAASRQGLYCSV